MSLILPTARSRGILEEFTKELSMVLKDTLLIRIRTKPSLIATFLKKLPATSATSQAI